MQVPESTTIHARKEAGQSQLQLRHKYASREARQRREREQRKLDEKA